jgi:flagellar hook-associated protein 1 FlgK
LRAAQNQSSGLTTRYEQMSKIDNLLSSKTSSISTSMQGFLPACKRWSATPKIRRRAGADR